LPPSQQLKRTALGITLLAWLSLVLASLIWGVSLIDSINRPGVANALEQRQLELNLLAKQGDQNLFPQQLIESNPEQLLLESVATSSAANSSKGLLEQALLEQKLGKKAAAKAHLETVEKIGNKDEIALASALLATTKSTNNRISSLPPLPNRPVYRLLSCDALAKPSQLCVAPGVINQAKIRLLLVNLLPLSGVIAGVFLLGRLGWQTWRHRLEAAPELSAPDLTLIETILIVAGGFVVLGEVIVPLVAMPFVSWVANHLPLSSAARGGAVVMGLYSFTAAPALLLIWAFKAGGLQWRAEWNRLAEGGKGLLLALPPVALVGWIVEKIWPQAGGSNPLLEQVLDSRNGTALFLLAFTAVVLAPLFEEILFRGVLMPVVGRYWGNLAGITISATIFALAHLSLSEAAPLLVLGLGLGWIRLRSGSLVSCVVMHGLWNGLTFFNLIMLGS
jgi:membrane protease YdiL (CAAX protease family)